MTFSAARVGSGYVGHFSSLSDLTTRKPPADFAGRTATVELSAGYATPHICTGTTWFPLQDPNNFGTLNGVAMGSGSVGAAVQVNSLGVALRRALQSGGFPASMASPPTIGPANTTASLTVMTAWDSGNIALKCARWVKVGANPRATPVTTDYKADGTSLFGNSGRIPSDFGHQYRAARLRQSVAAWAATL